MIYTISNNYITFEEDQKRTYPNGGKFKTNAEERQDEESYHLKSNKKQKKGGALSSTLAVKDMSSALSRGEAEEDEDTSYVNNILQLTGVDIPLTESDQLYGNITNVANLTLHELHKISEIEGITDYKSKSKNQLLNLLKPTIALRKKETAKKRDKIRIQAYHKKDRNVLLDKVSQQRQIKKKKDEITYDINWNMKTKPKYLSLSNAKKKELVDKIYLNGDDISQKDKFLLTLRKYNINFDYDLSIQGQVNDLHDNMSNCKKDGNGNYIIKQDGIITPIKDRGYFFELVMLSQYQDIIKKCCSDINQPDFKPSDDQPKLQGLLTVHWNPNSSPLSKWYIYDAFNKFFEIEFKFYEDDTDYVEIQPAKFEGGHNFTPYFCLYKGKYVLYNIWCDCPQYTGFINKENYKEIIFCVFKKGDIYSWSLTDFVNSDDCEFLETPSKIGPKGEELFEIDLDYSKEGKIGPFDKIIRINKNTKKIEEWIKIPLKDFNKIT
jgi:hypothetical protein